MQMYPGALATLFTFLSLSSAMIYKLNMPEGLQTHFDGAKMKHNTSHVPGEQIFWECMQRIMWQMSDQMSHNVTRETRDYLNRLLHVAIENRNSQVPRYRKEYRMLTDDERNRFHKAVKALKEDKTLEPSVYSAFAELHAGDVIRHAHFGVNFLGWHRIFLLIFETALRLKDASVSVPYWASNLDSEMEDPTQSVIWTDKFLGNGDGFVTTGPFANFELSSTDSKLTRNIGESGSLMTNEGIHDILSMRHIADISNPSAPATQNIEMQHNLVHAWMGGNMDDLSTSAEDPVFHMHHSFIDYLWEEFRTRQILSGVDPKTDYPTSDYGSEEHKPTKDLGFGDLRNMDAIGDMFANMVKYEPSPSCSSHHPTCGSRYLRCEKSMKPPICISVAKDEERTDNIVCVEPSLRSAIQNTFAINKHCDIRKWAYIPVKIVLQRPPEFSNYKAFPVINNEPVTDQDVFSTISVHKNISRHLATYPKCRRTNSVARKVYIESYGLNYYGRYKDFTALDQRHALSAATTYLGVKSPDSNHSDVIVYAYDYCGRTCRPYCLDATTNPPKYRPCAGVIRITPELPKLYGSNYAEAVNTVWRADGPDELPEVEPQTACITFYCDYSGEWPWDREIQSKPVQLVTPAPRKAPTTNRRTTVRTRATTTPRRQKTRAVPLRPLRTLDLRRTRLFPQGPRRPTGQSSAVNSIHTANRLSMRRPLFRPFTVRPPSPRPLPQGSRRSQRTRNRIVQCRLGPSCLLLVPCSPCQSEVRIPCRGPVRMFAICINGIFMLEHVFFRFIG